MLVFRLLIFFLLLWHFWNNLGNICEIRIKVLLIIFYRAISFLCIIDIWIHRALLILHCFLFLLLALDCNIRLIFSFLFFSVLFYYYYFFYYYHFLYFYLFLFCLFFFFCLFNLFWDFLPLFLNPPFIMINYISFKM